MLFVLGLIIPAALAIELAARQRDHAWHSQRIASYRHPALAPARIQSPEFYASLSARYNRPFLGK
ncbi:hypothetical protein SCRES3_gp65 [Synechococcus phage S-CRES3]|nr:hypothetical protein SCRES3_gp65 [Synechococcus phage S-CRES3]